MSGSVFLCRVNGTDFYGSPLCLAPMTSALELCPHCGGEAVPGSTCPRAVLCPTCGARPGSPCRRPSEHRADGMHAARVHFAEDLDRANGITYPPAGLEDLDVHAGGQIRLGAAGDQLELLPLEDSAIPADATVPPTPAELELERRHEHEGSTTL